MVAMHMPDSLRKAALCLLMAALALPVGIDAQLRSIVTKSVSASSSGSSIELHFDDQTTLSIALDDGVAFIDGESAGSFERGDELDQAWRDLLVEAMSLENGELAEVLEAWEAPSSDVVAMRVDQALERALGVEQSESVSDAVVQSDATSLARFLLQSLGRLGVLDEALADLEDEDVQVHVDEDVTIEDGESVEGTLVVIEGTLRVEGTLDGDAVLVGGALDLRDGGLVRGQVRMADSRVLRSSGEVRGGIVDLLEDMRESESELRTELRNEIRDEVREDLRRELRDVARFESDDFSIMTPFRPVIRGVGGVVEKLVAVFLLGLLGAGFIAFAGQNVDAISETARRSPGRAAAVGFAGSFLLVPVWLLGALALIVSIVGIPVAIAWLPLFPIAAMLAALLGIVAVARNTGEWLADSTLPWTGWIRKSNQVFTLFGGLLGLAGLFIAGHVISIIPVLGIFSALLFGVGTILLVIAAQIGFGAVLLTRAGRRREYAGRHDPDAAWAAAMDMKPGEDAAADTNDNRGEG
ncbi:MAG: hypothetical protein AAF389_07805 [Gemmatimonadota bacterium]